MPIPAGILLPKIKYTKRALTYEEQLDLRLIPRGLSVADRKRALGWLRRVGYYRLSGYLYPLRTTPANDQFKPGSTFEIAICLYKFDCELRLLCLQAIDRIEVAVRASVTYHLGRELGPFGHMNPTNFKPMIAATETEPAKGFDFRDFNGRVMNAEKQSGEAFIEHYREKYDEEALPIWMLTEIMSFGLLSKTTESLMDKEIQRKIARDFVLSQTQLVSWLRSLAYVRNVCAHHGRLWNRTISIKPELLPRWRRHGVTRDRVYVALLMMAHLLREIAPASKWAERVANHLKTRAGGHVSLSAMGVPEDWETTSPWAPDAPAS